MVLNLILSTYMDNINGGNEYKMTFEKIKLTDIIPAPYNPRKITETQKTQLRNSLETFGLVDPIIINLKNMTIIGGHQRYDAILDQYLLKGEYTPDLNLIRLGDIGWVFTDTDIKLETPEHEKALNIALNKINGEWDTSKLEEIFKELNLEGFDTELTGFTNLEISELEIEQVNLDETLDNEITEDEYEPEQELEVTVKPGDIYQLGRHRLMCGDSTIKTDIVKLIDGNTIDMIFTDPPYGMNCVSRSAVLSKRYKTDILNDDNNEVAIKSFKLMQQMYPNIAQIWWGANYYTEALPSSECWLVWDKNNGASDQTDCELAYSNLRSVVRQFTFASEKKGRVHPTQKPLRLYDAILTKFQNKGTFNSILDLFGGGGSTLIFCEQTGRTCYMMELDPYYCQVIINRWEHLTGEKAVKLN